MAGPSTRRALGRRAIETMNFLSGWMERLEEEMEKQGIKLYADTSDIHNLVGDDEMTFTMTRRDVRELIHGMSYCIAEIKRFKH
ncbi:MAG TPA: hypothetical protein VKT73_08755 [Xanthobacteraceae bacterium]|nr:hypothetical protein [Xanthobacteraceae bacterium]